MTHREAEKPCAHIACSCTVEEEGFCSTHCESAATDSESAATDGTEPCSCGHVECEEAAFEEESEDIA